MVSYDLLPQIEAFYLLPYYAILNETIDIFIIAHPNPVFIKEKTKKMEWDPSFKKNKNWFNSFESYCSYGMTIIKVANFGK